jgi:hypothetical protein
MTHLAVLVPHDHFGELVPIFARMHGVASPECRVAGQVNLGLRQERREGFETVDCKSAPEWPNRNFTGHMGDKESPHIHALLEGFNSRDQQFESL